MRGRWEQNFDAWQEHFNYKIWNDAFSNNDLNPEFYSQRLREDAEILPWDHIQTGVSKSTCTRNTMLVFRGRQRMIAGTFA